MLKFSLAAAAVLLALTALAVAQDDCTTCIGDPTDPSCASCDYALGNATADIENLCQVMPGMSMCSLKIICESGSGGVSEEYCTPMSLLASTCSIDTGMGSMSGCANYNVLCKGTSAVRSPSCDALAMPMLPTTISVVNAVKDICTDHFMADCDRCDSTFTRCDDPLLTLSMMCNVHEMGPCAEFYAFCEENGQAATGLCQTLDAHGDRIPTMRMYFHTGLEDFVLFYSWVPRTVGGYVVTFFGIMAIGIFSAFLKASKVMVEEKWRRRRAKARRAKQASKITWTRSSPTVMKWERDPKPASSASAGLPDASALSGEAIVDGAAPLGISRSPHTSYSSSTDEQEEWLSSETDAGAGVVQRRTRAAEEGSPAGLGGPDGPAAPMALAPPTSWKPDDWTENVLRFGFQLMIVTIDYGLMLISMTFNAGLFIATVLGIALGHLFFGHVIAKGPEVADCCG